MRIVLMGSAAAEAVPSLWCRCDVCEQARQNGGKDIRRRTCYKIDEDTLVDFGPDAFDQSRTFDVDWNKLKRIIYTHQHEDHLNTVELFWRRKGFAQNVLPIDIYGSPLVWETVQRIAQAVSPECLPEKWEKTVFHPMAVGETVTAGDITIFNIPANHSAEDARNYLITRGGKSVLIAHDTGFWKEAGWAAMAGHTADAVIFDGTCALRYPDCADGHMGANIGVKFRDELVQRGMLKKNGLAVVNHFSHNGNSLQADLEKFFAPYGIEVGYDGKVIEL